MSSRRALLESLLLSRLPSAFQEVEYIESTGTQYIDTGYILGTNIDLVAKAKINCSSTQPIIYPRVFGSRQTNPDRAFMLGSARAWYGLIDTNRTPSIVLNDDTTHIIQFDKNGLEIDNNLYAMEAVVSSLTNVIYNIVLFAENENGVIKNKSNLKIFWFQLFNGNTLVRNFVPCYRKADNEIGLYDLVNDVFYTNAGTGTFTKGGNV